jgi:4-amino-4-deoxy-L-arabinose transferase-like glycosyltransferase
MSELQDLIHKLEEGIGARIIKGIALALGLLALAAVYDWREYKCFATQDSMDMAQLARNISEGKGYTTHVIRPLSLHLVQEKAKAEGRNPNEVLRNPHPDLANPPVYPWVLAALMKVLPLQYTIPQEGEFGRYQPELIISGMNQILFVLVIVLTFFLARRLFDPQVAWLTAAILAGTDLLWRFSISGLATMLLLLIFLGLLWVLAVMEEHQRETKSGEGWFLGMAAAAGLLAGVGGLTRYGFGFVIIPVVVFFLIFFAQRRIALSGVALVTFLAVMAPWIARNWVVSGTPFGVAGYAVLQELPFFPGERLLRLLSPDLRGVMLEDCLRKLMLNLSSIVTNDLPKLGGSWLSGLCLVSVLITYRSAALKSLRAFGLLVLPVFALVQALGRTHLSTESPDVNSDNLLVLLTPLVFMFGVALFNQLLDQIELPFPPLRTWVAGTFGVVMCAPLLFTFLPPRSYPVNFPPYHPPLIQQASFWLDEKEMMMSDMPWAVAWYGNRTCLWTTLSVQPEFFEINDRQKPISAIYLTQLTTDKKFQSEIIHGEDLAWGRFYVESLLKTNLPPGWTLRHAPAGFLEAGQMFLTDRPRWKFQQFQRSE